jgi:putative spermidine/putrescine transport system permease protein
VVAVADAATPVRTSDAPSRRPGTSRPWGRWIILVLFGAYFLIPLYAGLSFAVTPNGGFSLDAFTGLVSAEGFTEAFGLSLSLALVTTVITLALMVPTAIYVHLRVPAAMRVFEGITILPIVIPPVVLIVGVLDVAPSSLKGTPYLLALVYAVITMPFAYRSLDSGLRALSLKTLVEASQSLGGGWFTTLFRVLLPNLRSAVLSATILTVALVLGEYTMATLDQYETFPVWIVVFSQDDAHVSVAASVASLLVTWLLLILISLIDRRRGRSTPGES